MTSSFAAALATQFNAPVPHPQLSLIKFLKDHYPNSQHLSVSHCSDAEFPLSAYLATINITPLIVEDETHSLVQYNHGQRIVYTQVIAGATKFTYASQDFSAYKATWRENHMQYILYHLVFDGSDDSVGQDLASNVYKWANSLKEEIWVFEDGHWHKSKELYQAVHSTTWETIVLKDEFKEGLRRDTKTFFSSKETYRSLGITWKRGLLLLGPPGNGKTESIKALLNEFKDTCAALYVKSFSTRMGPEHGVRNIFDHARKQAPCILVLEDLDAMVTTEVRSFFLNELDGLAHNEGILTISTTNHPELIDDAILNRPSRFDVKYNFSLPGPELRKVFADKWIEKIRTLESDAGIGIDNPEEIAAEVSEKTEGWTFAFLKELFVSFLLRVAHDKSLRQTGVEVPSETADVLLIKQVDQLETQIIKIRESEASTGGPAVGGTRMASTNAAGTVFGRFGGFAVAKPATVSGASVHPGTNF